MSHYPWTKDGGHVTVAHAVNAFFREFEHLPAKQKKKIADALLKPILPSQRYTLALAT
jgi:hypothetical protein